MKRKIAKKPIIFNFTPSVIEIEKIIKKYPKDDIAPCKIKLTNNMYRFKNSKDVVSPCYAYAFDYDRGYAFVLDHGEYFYIDPDFDTVVCEEKIHSCGDLVEVIKTNPSSVLKYVSTQKIEELREPVVTAFTLGEGTKKQAEIMDDMLKTLDAILLLKPEYSA